MTCDKDFADQIIKGNGRISPENTPDNPWVTRIVEYDNAWGGTGYGITFQGQDKERYTKPTQYVRNPRIYWERNNGSPRR